MVACTMSTPMMLGSTCWKVMLKRFLPQARAAVMYSRVQMALAEARVMRAKVGILKMPMAMMALTMLGPNTAVIMMASKMAGKAKVKSLRRMMTSSTQPRRADASRPRATPKTRPMPTAITPTAMELRAPTMSCESTSRPKASVPSQCWLSGSSSLASMFMA